MTINRSQKRLIEKPSITKPTCVHLTTLHTWPFHSFSKCEVSLEMERSLYIYAKRLKLPQATHFYIRFDPCYVDCRESNFKNATAFCVEGN